jgi:predicted Holliday junction resolvase-like endonuclease
MNPCCGLQQELKNENYKPWDVRFITTPRNLLVQFQDEGQASEEKGL